MHCANPQCRVESAYLRSGGLYEIHEDANGRVRFLWLCGRCASQFVVESWRPAGQQLRPTESLRDEGHRKPCGSVSGEPVIAKAAS
jgi:hypothetical protein